MQIRLLPAVLAVFLVLFSSFVHAEGVEDKVSFSHNMYNDNTGTGIRTTTLGIVKKLSERFGFSFEMGYDAITTATPPSNSDTATEADETHEKDDSSGRYFPSLSGIYDDGENNFVLGGYYSMEEDYTGRSIFANYTRRLNMQNTALGIGLSRSFDKWDLDDLEEDEQKATQLNLTASQLLTVTSMIQFIYTYIYTDGLIASPYRNIEIENTIVNERLPLERRGNAVALKYVQQIFDPASLHLSYRYYFDDWDIRSHTAGLELYGDVTETVTLGGSYRYYDQTAASFTKDPDEYELDDRYIAVDYKFGDFRSHTAGVLVLYTPRRGFLEDVTIKMGLDYYWTSEHPLIDYWYGESNITATIFSFSVDYPF